MEVTALALLLLLLVGGIGFFAARATSAAAAADCFLSGYLVVFALVVLLVLFLSLFGALSRIALLAGLSLALCATIVASQIRSPIAGSRRGWRGTGTVLRSETLLAPLSAIAAGGLGYSTMLVVSTAPNSWDSMSYHLTRVAFWLQNGAVGYIGHAYDQRLNGNPPNGEIGQLLVFAMTGSERLTGFVQLVAALACAIGVFGIASRLGRTSEEAAIGSLLFLTLPIVLLQASSTQNDLIVASFLVTATFFLLGYSRRDDVLAAVAVALACGAKLTAIYALPILLALALSRGPTRARIGRIVAVGVGAACGSYWYVINLIETHRFFGELADATVSTTFLEPRRNVTTAFNFLLDSFDLSGAEGADIWLYLITALAAMCIAVIARSARSPGSRIRDGILVLAVGMLPFALIPIGHGLWRVYAKLVSVWSGPPVPFDTAQHHVSRVASDSFSWFGPLAAVFAVATLAACIPRARRHTLALPEALLAFAPVYWLLALSASITYDPWRGRFFVFPIALSSALWGAVVRWRPLAIGSLSIAATTVVLCLVHFYEKPSGLRLLERTTAPSVWGQPRWRTQAAIRPELAPVLRYLETDVPHSARVALALGGDDWGYPPFGSHLSRSVTLIPAGAQLPPRPSDWIVVSPLHPVIAGSACWRVVLRTTARHHWLILRRVGRRC